MYWRAKYINGETVTEMDGVSSDRLNRTMLSELSVMDNGIPIYTVTLEPGRKHFYRKRISLKPGERESAIHIMGYKYGNSWHIAVVHDDHKDRDI